MAEERPVIEVPYADPATAAGVKIYDGAEGLVIEVPRPISAWGMLVAIVGIGLNLMIFGSLLWTSGMFIPRALFLALLALAGGIAAVVMAICRWPARIVKFVISPHDLTIHGAPELTPDRRAARVMPRSAIYDVHYVEHSSIIIIRGHGQDMIYFAPTGRPVIDRWLAGYLNEQLLAPLAQAHCCSSIKMSPT